MNTQRLLYLAAYLDTCEIPQPHFFTAGAVDVLPDLFPENWERMKEGYPMYNADGFMFAPLDGCKLFFQIKWYAVGHLFTWGAQRPAQFGGWMLPQDAKPRHIAGLIRAFVNGGGKNAPVANGSRIRITDPALSKYYGREFYVIFQHKDCRLVSFAPSIRHRKAEGYAAPSQFEIIQP